uniref:C2H2-type domain-containing protein n=1 Tax=Anoplophora glabripennis TaxID=217634 RepID=V5G9B5_ANOGL
MEAFNCSICCKTFSRSDNLKRHLSSIHSSNSHLKMKMYKCSVCSMQSTYKNNVIRHLKKVHAVEECEEPSSSYEQINDDVIQQKGETSIVKEKPSSRFCETCNLEIAREKFASHERSLFHKQNSCVEIEPDIYLINSAFKRNIATYRIKCESQNDSTITDISLFFSKIKDKIIKLIATALRGTSLKINFELFACYVLSTKENDEEASIKNEVKSFNSKYEIVTTSTNLNDIYSHFYNVLKTKSEEFEVSKFIIFNIKLYNNVIFFIIAARFRLVSTNITFPRSQFVEV